MNVATPVPPPATPRVPERVGANVTVLPLAVMVMFGVRPLNAVVVVASVTAGPVWSWPAGPIEVIAEVRAELLIIMGDDPITVNPEQDTEPEQEADVVAAP